MPTKMKNGKEIRDQDADTKFKKNNKIQKNTKKFLRVGSTDTTSVGLMADA